MKTDEHKKNIWDGGNGAKKAMILQVMIN